MSVVKQITNCLKCSQSGIVLVSTEPAIVFEQLCTIVADRVAAGREDAWELMFWDNVDYLIDAQGNSIHMEVPGSSLPGLKGGQGSSAPYSLHQALARHYSIALQRVQRQQQAMDSGVDADDDVKLEDSRFQILVIRNADRLLYPDGPMAQVDKLMLQQLQKIALEGQKSYVYIVLQVTPGFELPKELENYFEYVTHGLPDADERLEIIQVQLGVKESWITDKVLEASAGLSRTKTVQYAAETLAEKNNLDPRTLFIKKAAHLARCSKLEVWSPEFNSQVGLNPIPKLDKYKSAVEMKIVAEENSFNNEEIPEDHIRVRINYLDNATHKHVDEWLEAMPKEDFDKQFRPDRNYYSFKSVMGLTGLKQFFQNSFRSGIPERSKLKHVMLVGVPGTGKSHIMKCLAGEFGLPLCSFKAANLHSKWVGESDKNLVSILETAGSIGGLFAFDEFQRLLPQGGSDEAGGTENRLLGELLTWFNDQTTNVIVSAANNISKLPDEITRSGRVDALFYVGFPDKAARADAWRMYMKRHNLAEQELPEDNYWVPADIMSCCRLAEQQGVPIMTAAKWIMPSYRKSPTQMDALMQWAESVGCICASTGEKYSNRTEQATATAAPNKLKRKIQSKE